MHKFLRQARQKALDHEFDEFQEFFLCALIVKGGTVVSTGFNNQNTNQFVEHYANLARGRRDYCLSTHAEMDAVLKVRNKTDLRGTKIYVARVKADGSIGMSRPCCICQQVLYNYGIKRAFYTINDNEYGVMRVVHHNENSDKLFSLNQ